MKTTPSQTISVQIDFQTWHDRLKRHLRTQPALKETFRKWFDHAYAEDHRTDENRREFAERIYRKTARAFTSKTVKQQHATARRQLERLHEVLKSTIGAIDTCQGVIESRDGKTRFRASQFVPKLNELERMTAGLIDDKNGVLERNYMHTPTMLTYCLPLLLEMDAIPVCERDQVELFRVIMKCHGALEYQLEQLSHTAIKNKTIKKAKKAFLSGRHTAQ